jgi:hypothetical protein
MHDLFDAAAPAKPKHDPGGKVETALPAGMRGGAEFYGSEDQYRLSLTRAWESAKAEMDTRYILWIGMNPSTARADVNDPTITREINFSKAWGYFKYVKCNVMDYRATNPRQLIDSNEPAQSDRNLGTILRLALRADKIVICYGVLDKRLQHYADEIIERLKEDCHGPRLYCMGRTLLGHPRHPLYLSNETQLVPFR